MFLILFYFVKISILPVKKKEIEILKRYIFLRLSMWSHKAENAIVRLFLTPQKNIKSNWY